MPDISLIVTLPVKVGPVKVGPVKVGPVKSAFKSKAICCAVDTGFPASVVLSTFPNPTLLADNAVVKLSV